MENISPKIKTLLLSALIGAAEAAGYVVQNSSLILFALLMAVLAAAVSFAVLGRWKQGALMLLASLAVQFAVLFVLLIGFSSSGDSAGAKMFMSGYLFGTPFAVMLLALIMRKVYDKKQNG